MPFETWWRVLRLRLRSLFRRNTVERELTDELRYHLEQLTQDLVAKGLTRDEARYTALKRMGPIEQHKEECRDVRGTGIADHLRRDSRYAVRGLIKTPGFTCGAILTLALGIGANAALFTLVNSVLLRQLPFRNADRLVWIWSTRTDRDKAFYSIPNFIDTRQQSRTLEDIAAFANWGVNLTGSGEAVRLSGVRISANAFEMLGVDAAFGRMLQQSDGAADSGRVAVISYGTWVSRFGRSERIVGQSILLNGAAYAIVGVLPPDFALPNAQIDVASPLILETDSQRTDRGSNFLRTFARLKGGITPEQAASELAGITDRLKQQYPSDNAKHTAPRVLELREEIVGSYRVLLWTLLGGVGIVLLIACTNLANMMLVRSAGRRRDFAIRAALGGTRAQMTRELMTMSALLSAIGGSLGIVVASLGVRLLLSIGPADLPRIREVALDWPVIAFATCLSVLVALIFGLTPATQAFRTDLSRALRSSGKSQSASASSMRMRRILVVSEIALSLLLLIGAALLFRSFVNLQSVSAGVNTKDLMSVRFSLPAAKYSEPAAMAGFVQQLTRNVQTSSGVRSVSAVTILPLSGMNTRADFTIDGKPPAREDEKPAAQNRWIAPEYFRTMGIPLIAGRDFTDLDTARSQAVIIIDETLARRHFPTDTPLGKHLHVSDSGPAARDVEIVGVTGNVKHFGLEDTPINTYYSPLTQVPQPALGFVANGLNLVVRTEPRLSVSDELRRHIQSLDPDVPAATAQTMDQLIASTVAPRRFNLLLIEIFAGAALLLAAMGLYSVIAYSVVQRRNEIGIRMALGATPSDVFRQMLREGVLLTISGELIGLVFAFATTRFLSGLLFQVHATDPWTFAVISAILAVTALIACYVPARRVTLVDPSLALRME